MTKEEVRQEELDAWKNLMLVAANCVNYATFGDPSIRNELESIYQEAAKRWSKARNARDSVVNLGVKSHD